MDRAEALHHMVQRRAKAQRPDPEGPCWGHAWTSPVGTLAAVVDDDGRVRSIEFAGKTPPARAKAQLEERDGAVIRPEALRALETQLREYFKKSRKDFDLVLAPVGTPFQLEVWQALRKIPFGTTCSYAQIAAAIGRPKAVRAVGAANGANPHPIVVPCHRVIGANGSLTGFGGGMAAKRWLLDHEAAQGRLC